MKLVTLLDVGSTSARTTMSTQTVISSRKSVGGWAPAVIRCSVPLASMKTGAEMGAVLRATEICPHMTLLLLGGTRMGADGASKSRRHVMLTFLNAAGAGPPCSAQNCHC